jgi:MarR family transcriptional regulator, transcriptional regulator for hemolysin
LHTITELFPLVLYETAAVWRNQLDKRLKPLGLSQAKWRTLLNLSLADKPLTQTELAARLGIENATLVGLLDRLTQDGWISRCDVPNNRRSKMVCLTAQAQEALVCIHTTANQLRNELLSIIAEPELRQCLEVLQRIRDQAKRLTE